MAPPYTPIRTASPARKEMESPPGIMLTKSVHFGVDYLFALTLFLLKIYPTLNPTRSSPKKWVQFLKDLIKPFDRTGFT